MLTGLRDRFVRMRLPLTDEAARNSGRGSGADLRCSTRRSSRLRPRPVVGFGAVGGSLSEKVLIVSGMSVTSPYRFSLEVLSQKFRRL